MSKEEYETCRLPGQPQRVVAICDQPQPGKQARPIVTVTFRSFTPMPQGIEFTPGQDYYFVTALIGQHLSPSQRMAPCRDQNMRVIFKVCCKSSAAPQASPLPPRLAASLAGSPRRQAQPPPTLRPVLRGEQPPAPPAHVVAGLPPAPAPPPEPVTVFPIERLESPSPATNELAPAAASSTQEPQTPNDIPQNDFVGGQSGFAAPPPPPPPPPQLQRRPPPIFDPSKTPEDLLKAGWPVGRYPPTPIPAWLIARRQPQPAPPAASIGGASLGQNFFNNYPGGRLSVGSPRTDAAQRRKYLSQSLSFKQYNKLRAIRLEIEIPVARVDN